MDARWFTTRRAVGVLGVVCLSFTPWSRRPHELGFRGRRRRIQRPLLGFTVSARRKRRFLHEFFREVFWHAAAGKQRNLVVNPCRSTVLNRCGSAALACSAHLVRAKAALACRVSAAEDAPAASCCRTSRTLTSYSDRGTLPTTPSATCARSSCAWGSTLPTLSLWPCAS